MGNLLTVVKKWCCWCWMFSVVGLLKMNKHTSKLLIQVFRPEMTTIVTRGGWRRGSQMWDGNRK